MTCFYTKKEWSNLPTAMTLSFFNNSNVQVTFGAKDVQVRFH